MLGTNNRESKSEDRGVDNNTTVTHPLLPERQSKRGCVIMK